MAFYRRGRSTSSSDNGFESQSACKSPTGTCLKAAPSCEPIQTSPRVPLTTRTLRLLSIHPDSSEFVLVSLLLDITFFYLVQALQFTVGVALLHTLYPAEPDYAMSTARSMRIGAAGGAMFVGVVTLRSLLQLGCCDPEEDAPEQWTSVWDAVGCLAKRTPDVRYVAFIGISGSVVFGRGMYDMNSLLHAATAALVGYVVLSASKGALSWVRQRRFSL